MLRGFEAIHATAVSIDGAACAFLGPTGAGKSTLAINFASAGAPLLGDDCVVLSVASDAIVLTPGYAGARLWDDSFDALGLDPAASKIVPDLGLDASASGNTGTTGKRRVPHLGRAFSATPQPLKRIYRLSRLDDDAEQLDFPADHRNPAEHQLRHPAANQLRSPAIEEMSPAESLIELASASYRFNPTDRIRNLAKFRFLEKVVATVPIKRLIVPNDFAMLPAVRDLILADLANATPATVNA
jgi:hypothetical protein